MGAEFGTLGVRVCTAGTLSSVIQVDFGGTGARLSREWGRTQT
jgi:hypothetical protein